MFLQKYDMWKQEHALSLIVLSIGYYFLKKVSGTSQLTTIWVNKCATDNKNPLAIDFSPMSISSFNRFFPTFTCSHRKPVVNRCLFNCRTICRFYFQNKFHDNNDNRNNIKRYGPLEAEIWVGNPQNFGINICVM